MPNNEDDLKELSEEQIEDAFNEIIEFDKESIENTRIAGSCYAGPGVYISSKSGSPGW